MTPLLFLHPAAPLDLTRPSIHWSTVIGLAILGALYWWRARAVRDAGVVLEAVEPSGGGCSASAVENNHTPRADDGDTPAVFHSASAAPVSGKLYRSPHQGPSAPRAAAFATALLIIFLSLNGPIHDLSDYYLFSAHMVQHLLLTLVAAPLLVIGTTGEMLRPLLRHRLVIAIARFITKPAICYAIFNVVIAFWHLPLAYNAAMADHDVHIVQHLTLMAASVLMWWPLLSPLPELPRLSYPGQMLYCFLMVIPMSVVAIYIAMADTLLYPAYASAPRMWGITPMMDQQIGGLIMWIPGGLFFYGIMTVVFFRWASRGEDTREAAQVNWIPQST